MGGLPLMTQWKVCLIGLYSHMMKSWQSKMSSWRRSSWWKFDNSSNWLLFYCQQNSNFGSVSWWWLYGLWDATTVYIRIRLLVGEKRKREIGKKSLRGYLTSIQNKRIFSLSLMSLWFSFIFVNVFKTLQYRFYSSVFCFFYFLVHIQIDELNTSKINNTVKTCK